MAIAFLAACLIAGFSPTDIKAAGNHKKIDYADDIADARARAKTSGKPVIIFFHAEWCSLCRKMRRITLKNEAVLGPAQSFEWVEVDIDRNLSLAREYRVEAIPQLQIIDADGRLRAVIVGNSDADELAQHLTEALNHARQAVAPGTPKDPMRIEDGPSVVVFGVPDAYRGRSICFANVGYGPLDLPSQSPLQLLRLGLSPRAPSTLAGGDKELHLRATWVNIWANETDYFFDYETLQTDLAFSYGLSDTFQLDIGFQTQSRFGGAMDSLIQEFHDLFGIDQNGRDQVPRDEFNFGIDPSASQPGVTLTGSDRGLYATSTSLTLQHNVTCGTESLPAFAYALTMRYELKSEDLQGGSPVDLGASIATSKRYSDFYIYGTLGYTFFGREQFRGIELRDTQWSFLAAVEWRAFSAESLMVQYLVTEGLANDLGDLSDPSHEITLGAKWEVITGTVIEVGLIENIITFGNSPDFGLHLGVTTRF
jgi:thiol-disulfide isomerase/thioredoxin